MILVKTDLKPEQGSSYKYEVKNDKGEVIYKTTTHREYVAILIGYTLKGKGYAVARFGRPDLIGKGASRYYMNRPEFHLAKLEENETNN